MGGGVDQLGRQPCRHCVDPGPHKDLENPAAEKIGDDKPYRYGQAANQYPGSQFLQMLKQGHLAFFVGHLAIPINKE
jgi:hypothetical protein